MYNNGTVSNETVTNYTYGDANWGDLLTGYDGEGISYDAIGNPLSYYNGKRYTFSWLYGRRLASAVVDGKTTTYTYNTEGLRLTKTASGVVHTYYWDGSTLLLERWGNSYLNFIYDESGAPLRMEYYNGSTTTVYYYVLNLQGDVLEIRDTANNVVCRYSYDAWGKLLSVKDGSGNSIASATHIGILNPLRYRGYYYDTETGLYYLQSRYYDPQVGRFISPDTYISTGQGMLGYNMYAYCLNNPVWYTDRDGKNATQGLTQVGWQKIFNESEEENTVWWQTDSLWEESFSLYDNDRFSDDNSFHEEVFSLSTRGPSLNFLKGDVGFGSVSADFIKGGWSWKYADLELFDIGHAEAAAEMNDYQVNVSAMASAWSPSMTFKIGKLKISIGGEVGAVGFKFSGGQHGVSLGGAAGVGFSINIDW